MPGGGEGEAVHVLAALLVTASEISHVAANSPTGGGGVHSPFFFRLSYGCLQQLVAIDPPARI